MKESFKIGDTVRRFAGGKHGTINEGESFVIQSLNDRNGQYYDHNDYSHDGLNLELVHPKEEINNTYSIY